MKTYKNRKKKFLPQEKSLNFFKFRSYRILILIIFITTLAHLASPQYYARAANNPPIEYKVKAAYIIKFFNFFQWAALNSTKPDQPYRIGVLGDSPIYNALKEFLKTHEGSPIELIEVRPGESLPNLHFLFISKNYNNPIQKVLSETQTMKILTIGEESSFCLKGGIVNFVIVNEKIKFEINRNAARESGIEISSRILRAASKIYP